ncbi:MAG: tRNA pseudouridine(38-40) synthase TruA [Actinomycetaceae bacterium]|nr:tRNA pseudouridine(38-40) synthase TruA [Actinomycetaceae bacterium]
MRIRLDIAYDGTGFAGWARQNGLRTVQGTLEGVLETICRTPVPLTVAGRTDAGVHARGQVAHANIPDHVWEGAAQNSADLGGALARRINGLLARADMTGVHSVRGRSDVIVRHATAVSPDFDARFSATWRHYVYRIADRWDSFDPLVTNVWWLGTGALNDAQMGRAAGLLLGEHDFLSFCKPREGATTIRTLTGLELRRNPEGVLEIHVRADAFCHSMVRSLVGALVAVGSGRRDEKWPARRLAERKRAGEPALAPAHGLTLEAVGYGSESDWALRAKRARALRTLEVSGKEFSG